MTPLQQQNNRVLNAMDEAVVTTVIQLYDGHRLVKHIGESRRAEIERILQFLKVNPKTYEDLLDYYGV